MWSNLRTFVYLWWWLMSYVVTCLHVRRQMAKATVIMESSFGFSLASIVWEGRSVRLEAATTVREVEKSSSKGAIDWKELPEHKSTNFCAPYLCAALHHSHLINALGKRSAAKSAGTVCFLKGNFCKLRPRYSWFSLTNFVEHILFVQLYRGLSVCKSKTVRELIHLYASFPHLFQY